MPMPIDVQTASIVGCGISVEVKIAIDAHYLRVTAVVIGKIDIPPGLALR